jgi:hypothetical protein
VNKIGQGLPVFFGGRNIQEYQFVSTGRGIIGGQFHRVTCIAERYKIDALYSTPVFYIQAGYDSFC